MPSEFDAADLFAPPGGWRVRIIDLSADTSDNVVEEIKGFPTIMHANAFARRYVRDSVELCRDSSFTPGQVMRAWFAYGENAEVVDAGEAGWQSGTELADFADRPAGDEDRDWRALDPRRDDGDEDDDE